MRKIIDTLTWPYRWYKQNKEFKKQLAKLKRLDPFNDGDE